MLKNFIISLILIVGLMVWGCGKGKISLTLAGSTAFQPFAETLADQYMSSHPDISITVQGGGSAVGIQSANSGAAQIGMADLVMLPEEAKALTATIVAKDGIAVVVNPQNKVVNLSTDQVTGYIQRKDYELERSWRHRCSNYSRIAGSWFRNQIIV